MSCQKRSSCSEAQAPSVPSANSVPESSRMFRADNLSKLASKEGGQHYHVHRYLGLLVLLNYLYRSYLYWRRRGQPRGFPQGPASVDALLSTTLHAALSLSSLLFRVPARRSKKLPMMISLITNGISGNPKGSPIQDPVTIPYVQMVYKFYALRKLVNDDQR